MSKPVRVKLSKVSKGEQSELVGLSQCVLKELTATLCIFLISRNIGQDVQIMG